MLLFPSYEKNLNRDVSVSLALFIYLSSSLVSIKYLLFFKIIYKPTTDEINAYKEDKHKGRNLDVHVMLCTGILFFFLPQITSI